MRIRAGALAAWIGLTLASGAQAQEPRLLGYLCQVNVPTSQNWIPDLLFIAHDTVGGRVVVSDPVVLAFNDGLPVDGRVATDNRHRITFVWEYPVADRAGNRVQRMMYRATYLKASGELQISAVPLGYERRFHASGRCAVDSIDDEEGK